MKAEEQILLGILKEVLTGEERNCTVKTEYIDSVIGLAEKHSVLSLLYDYFLESPLKEKLNEAQKEQIKRTTVRITQQNYHLLFLAKYVTGLLKAEGVEAVLLKGSMAAAYYPVPELRKSGDVDLFVSDQIDREKLRKLFASHGMAEQKKQNANHHINFDSPDGITIEIHTALIEQTGIRRLDCYVKGCQNEFLAHSITKNVMGVELITFEDAYFMYFLLLHMVEDFLRAGFGLKLLCDWVVLWNKKEKIQENEKQTFLRLVTESGILGFARMITAVCIRYLGLREEKVAFLMDDVTIEQTQVEQFLSDILEAEEFGKASNERMVVLQQGGLLGLFKEFYHQLQLTYPKAARHPVLVPVLSVMLFCGFLHRNRTLRNVSTWKVIKNAMQRGRNVDEMNLFE